jgi:VWFA-related protein
MPTVRTTYLTAAKALGLLVCTSLLPPARARAQESSTTQSVPYTINVTTSLVPLDVVVTDKKGHPVHGLKRDAFRVIEDGVEQPIKVFEEHGSAGKKPVEVPKLPEGTYTNFPVAAVGDSVTVLLLDSLNTALPDQAYVHQQILAFLKTVPPGTSIAIFTLASKLRMLQSFTTDPAILTAVLKGRRALPKSSQIAGETDLNSYTQGLGDTPDPSILGVSASLSDFEGDFQQFQHQERMQITEDALEALGRYLVGVPGHKNLIWFAGNFPFGLSATPTGTEQSAQDMTAQEIEYRDLIDTYIRARISVYPVSAVGLQTDPLTSASQSNRGLNNAPALTQARINGGFNRGNEEIAMEKIAENTGGKSFFDTNGLKQAIETAVSDGENFYEVAYAPVAHDFDKQFHKITVAVEGKYNLSYRRGYYSDGPNGFAPAATDTAGTSTSFADAMVRGVPDSTAIIFKVHMEPVEKAADSKPVGDTADQLKQPTLRYDISYAASMRAMKITKTDDGLRHLALTVAAVVYDLDGKALNSLTRDVKLDLKPQAFADFVRSGLKLEEEIDVPSHPVFLKLGIDDPASGNMGTMEIPLKPEPPRPAPAPMRKSQGVP